MRESSTQVRRGTEPESRTPWATAQFWLLVAKYTGAMQSQLLPRNAFIPSPETMRVTLWAPQGFIAKFAFAVSEFHSFILWDKLLPASILVVSGGPNMLHLVVEERWPWQKKKKRSSAQQAAQPQVQQPLGACARTCDSAHAQPCGHGRGYLSRPYQLNPLLWKISVWGSFTSGEDERHRKRERDPFPRGNRVTENHRQPSCLAFSFIQTPNSPLQQITFQQGRLFCL